MLQILIANIFVWSSFKHHISAFTLLTVQQEGLDNNSLNFVLNTAFQQTLNILYFKTSV